MANRRKRTACPSCGAKFQRGKYVWRLLPDGPTRQRVCQTCAGYAVPILASDAPAHCEVCGTSLARFCGGCIGEVMEAQTGQSITAALVARGKAAAKRKRAER